MFICLFHCHVVFFCIINLPHIANALTFIKLNQLNFFADNLKIKFHKKVLFFCHFRFLHNFQSLIARL